MTLKINDFNIIERTSSYNISKQDITKNFEAANGDIQSYMIRKGRYSIDLNIVCNGDFFNQLDTIISNSDEFTVTFTYAETEHTAIMSIKNYKSDCITLNDLEYWSISMSLIECKR